MQVWCHSLWTRVSQIASERFPRIGACNSDERLWIILRIAEGFRRRRSRVPDDPKFGAGQFKEAATSLQVSTSTDRGDQQLETLHYEEFVWPLVRWAVQRSAKDQAIYSCQDPLSSIETMLYGGTLVATLITVVTVYRVIPQ